MAKKILLLSANPTDTSKLRLDEEVREIQSGLERAKRREEFEIISKLAVRVNDLRRGLLDHEPQIVHFSGHGGGSQGLALEDNSGQMQLVSASSLARLFKLFPTVECVVLNACYSEVQAEAIHQHIDYVIGMNKAIGDKAAIEFAVGFYDALGAGRTIEDGFEFGCTSIDLESIPESSTPVLKCRNTVNHQQTSSSQDNSQQDNSQAGKRIFISYKRDVQPDEEIALQIVQALSAEHQVFIDQKILVGTSWAELIETEIRHSDFLIVLLSEHSVHSEMMEKEITMAHEFAQERSGKPAILPVRLAYRQQFHYPLSAYLNHINWAYWSHEQDTPRLIEELKQAIYDRELGVSTQKKIELLPSKEPSDLPRPSPSAQPGALEIPEGTMKLKSAFYVERQGDRIALNTIVQQGVTISIKGPRQVGKSSLLNRIMKAARDENKRVLFLDFQLLGKADLSSDEIFLRQFCCWLSDELEMEDKVDKYWQKNISNIQRCTRYVSRYILKELDIPLVLAMDEVDKVFDTDFRNDFFGMLRNWHNSRAMSDIWNNLDFVLVTSTEPYQLIDDLNQSPFNVGQVIELEDFTVEQVADLNYRHGSLFNSSDEIKLMKLLNGHPYLTRKALYLVASGQITSTELFNRANSPRGPFGDHLRRLLSLLHDRQELKESLLEVVENNTCENQQIFWELRGAGLVRSNGQKVIPRCQLYGEYFREHLNS
ncbi:ATPase,TIR domain-containing protein [Rivularia sp. PCC 7116]|uniref:AAA-like domain-containing protein n=1 Tax=Rivularia sp. PCC 7116 TaxID=373994 RepID=UPI00029F42B0|nr:AAA-like domain-containing protein [Rivularia sp. PCC 7116]AFY58454.1 ATPase,TIR domain-containing protein [Rivularia sp. PCC 7116]